MGRIGRGPLVTEDRALTRKTEDITAFLPHSISFTAPTSAHYAALFQPSLLSLSDPPVFWNTQVFAFKYCTQILQMQLFLEPFTLSRPYFRKPKRISDCRKDLRIKEVF